MTPTHQELTLTLTTPNNNPILLTPTFLASSGIIPNDWQLARKPTLTPQHAQIAFTNGINITAQPNSIAFTESVTITNDQLPITNSPPALSR